MNSKAKSGKKFRKVVISAVLAVLIAAIAVTGVLTDGFRNFGKAPDSGVTLEQPGGGMMIGESEGSGVTLMSAKIAKEDHAAYGVSPMGGERAASDCNRGAGRCDGQVCGLEHSVRKSDVGMGER